MAPLYWVSAERYAVAAQLSPFVGKTPCSSASLIQDLPKNVALMSASFWSSDLGRMAVKRDLAPERRERSAIQSEVVEISVSEAIRSGQDKAYAGQQLEPQGAYLTNNLLSHHASHAMSNKMNRPLLSPFEFVKQVHHVACQVFHGPPSPRPF
jgi:hypothetical protein